MEFAGWKQVLAGSLASGDTFMDHPQDMIEWTVGNINDHVWARANTGCTQHRNKGARVWVREELNRGDVVMIAATVEGVIDLVAERMQDGARKTATLRALKTAATLLDQDYAEYCDQCSRDVRLLRFEVLREQMITRGSLRQWAVAHA